MKILGEPIFAKNPDGSLPTGLNGIGITTKCKNPERLLKFYDWLLQRDVQDYIQWGEEGKDWVRTESGSKAFTDERRALWRDSARRRDETGFTVWNYSPAWQGIYKIDGDPVTSGDSAGEYLASQSEYDQEFLKSYGIEYPAEMHSEPIVRPDYFPVWAMSLEDGSAAAIANAKITDVTTKHYSRLVLAEDDAAFDKIWDEFLTEFHAIDLDALKNEVTRQIAVKMGF
jgi:putative aldouronate transport system substrate-binding protein